MKPLVERNALFVGVALSVSMIVAATLSNHPFTGMILGMVPLVSYHFFLWWRTPLGLTQTTVDTVYYFGFLITVASLGASAMHVAGQTSANSTPDLQTVAFQFGLGLLATGYAVLARIHLMLMVPTLDEGDLQADQAKYLQRTHELIGSVELASSGFKAFAERLKQEVESSALSTQKELIASLRTASDVFASDTGKVLADATSGLRELRQLVAEVTVDADRSLFRESVRETTVSMSALGETFRTIRDSSNAAGQTLTELRQASSELVTTFGKVERVLERVSSSQGVLDRYMDGLTRGAEVAEKAGARVAELAEHLSAVIEVARDTGPHVLAMRDAAREIRGDIEDLSNATRTLRTTAVSVEDSGEMLSRVGSILNTVRERAERLDDSMAALSTRMSTVAGGVDHAVSSAASELERDVRRATEAVSKLTERMTEMVGYIIEKTREQREP